MKTADEINEWLVLYLAKLLDVHVSEINRTAPLHEYGIDSAAAAGLSSDLGGWLGLELKDSLVFDYPTIEGLGAYLSAKLQEGA
ncbi:MAG TPA: acyl carrier protein [Polyangiaceae bacterium]|nr:acyl carrier protein [Polyangiaceae bacterium]